VNGYLQSILPNHHSTQADRVSQPCAADYVMISAISMRDCFCGVR